MKTYLSFATELAEKAGAIILRYFATDLKREWKEDNTPVTEADIAVNKLVIESVLNDYPTHGILGEEESLLKESDYVWVCDPIDGTYPFSQGIPTFTFSLALTHQGEPIVAVVYDPVLKRMYTAEKGNGAFMNGKQITVSKAVKFDRQFIGVPGRRQSILDDAAFRKELYAEDVIFTSLNSLTYGAVMVAMGKFICLVVPKTHAWDCAAVKLLIDEAGGKTTDIYGNEQRYDGPIKGFVASNGIVHDEILAVLKKALK